MTFDEMVKKYSRPQQQPQAQIPDVCALTAVPKGNGGTKIASVRDPRISKVTYECHVQTEMGLAKLVTITEGNCVSYMLLHPDGRLVSAEDI